MLFSLLLSCVACPLLAASRSSDAPRDFLLDARDLGLESLNAEVQSQIDGLASRSSKLDKCQYACSLLSVLNPGTVTSSSQPNYNGIPYWSVQQSDVVPACRLDVSSSKAVSSAIKVSRLTRCPFAVKSGGHAAFAGGSSIEKGILINLGPLNQVTLSKDKSTASIGPGNKWYDVYSKLDAQNVSVIGGREAGVGTGGLTLGGGISYLSGRYGWACDNVRNYEVVLANGSIINANTSSHSDLYKALRGDGGTNYGVVTRFDLAAFEQGKLWGGSRYYNFNQSTPLINAFSKFVDTAHTDDFAHLYIAYGYATALGGFAAISGPTYGRPVPNPPIFKELGEIPNVGDATSIANMSTLAVELNQTAYQRQVFKTVSFKNSPKLMAGIVDLWQQEAQTLLAANITGFFPSLAFQPLSTNIITQMQKNGGNSLGLKVSDSPLVIMNMNWGWDLAKDDKQVLDGLNSFVQKSLALGEKMGLSEKFIYMNYATLEQNDDIYSGYGNESLANLKKVRDRYDPEGVFRKDGMNLWPGYFKLP